MVHRVVRNLRSLVVTNDQRERCHQHQGTIQILLDLLEIRFGTLNQELAEVRTIVTHDGDGVDDYPPLAKQGSSAITGAMSTRCYDTDLDDAASENCQ